MEDQLTVDDPKAYRKLSMGLLSFKRKADWEITEYNCLIREIEHNGYLEYQKRAWECPK